MTLAPIRGAPPGAPIPDFPIGEADAKPAQAMPVSDTSDPAAVAEKRQRGTPIEIAGDGGNLIFKVDPELPAIRRASMTIHAVASRGLGSLQMSAARAREFLTKLRSGRFPVVALGDEQGTVEITFAITQAGPAFSVHTPGEQEAVRGCVIDKRCDIERAADELLAELGA